MRANVSEAESSDKVLMRILNANGLLDDDELGSMLLRSVTKSHVARTGHSGDMDA